MRAGDDKSAERWDVGGGVDLGDVLLIALGEPE